MPKISTPLDSTKINEVNELFKEKIKIPKELLTDYTLNDILEENEETDNSLLHKVTILQNEFTTNLTKSKNTRAFYQKKWLEIDAYLWNDLKKLKTKVQEIELLHQFKNSASNLLLHVFNYRYGTVINSQKSYKIVVKPSVIPKSFAKELTDKKINEMQQELQNFWIKTKNIEHIIEYYFNQMNLDTINQKVYFDWIVFGTGFSEIFWNTDKTTITTDGELDIDYIPIWNVYLEPGIANIQDQSYLIITSKINLIDLSTQFNLDKETIERIQLKLNTNVNQTNENNQLGKDKLNEQLIADNTFTLYRYYKKYIKDKKTTIGLIYFIGNETNHQFLDINEDIGITRYPFEKITSYCNPTDQYGKSIIELAIPIQKQLIISDAYRQLQQAQEANPAILVGNISGVNGDSIANELDANGLELGKVYKTDGNPKDAIATIKLNQISPDTYTNKNQLIENLQMITNTTPNDSGQRAISGTSTGAVNQTIAQLNIPNSLNTIEAKSYIQGIVDTMIQYLSIKQLTNKGIIVSKNLKKDIPYAFVFNSESYKDIFLHANIKVNILNLQELNALKQTVLNLWQMQQQYPSMQSFLTPEDLLHFALDELPNKEEVLERYQKAQAIDYQQVSAQIIQIIQQNDMTAMQYQAALTQMQEKVGNGQTTDEQAQEYLDQIPKPLENQQLLQVIDNIIRQANPANMLNALQELMNQLATKQKGS